jgi:hypothetical protein
MERLLSTIECVLEIEGRGCAIAPGVPEGTDIDVCRGDTLRLERPDGTSLSTQLVEWSIPTCTLRRNAVIILPSDIRKADLPVGTRVFHCPAGGATSC